MSHLSSKLVKSKLPCPQPDCSSSDAYSLYDDGHGYCFSCSRVTPGYAEVEAEEATASYHKSGSNTSGPFTYQYIPWRNITKETMEYFGVQTKVDSLDTPISLAFPYPKGGKKVRSLSEKTFSSIGGMSDETLFGMDKFSGGEARSITICEGELDAMSIFQMLGSKYPVVSIRSASSGIKDCSNEYAYLNSFEKIYLCLDNDEPGKKATEGVAKLFDFNKIYHVNLTKYKDANEYLTKGEEGEFRNIWWNAKRFLPEGIISSTAEFDSILDNNTVKQGFTYPFPTLQSLTYGLRTGECTLFTAMEGIGKTEIVRAIEYALLASTNDNIGIIHLEESKARSLQGLVGYKLQQPIHLPDSMVSPKEVKAALHDLVKRDDRLHLYSHFGSSDPDVILSTIRFLVGSCGCRYIFLDHISMVVSGLMADDERKVLDMLSTKLAMMVEELDFALILVSHINDQGLTRGSRNISKVASTWIQLDRNTQESTEAERNKTYLTVRKNRFGSRTGPAGVLYFDPTTFCVTELSESAQQISLPPVG